MILRQFIGTHNIYDRIVIKQGGKLTAPIEIGYIKYDNSSYLEFLNCRVCSITTELQENTYYTVYTITKCSTTSNPMVLGEILKLHAPENKIVLDYGSHKSAPLSVIEVTSIQNNDESLTTLVEHIVTHLKKSNNTLEVITEYKVTEYKNNTTHTPVKETTIMTKKQLKEQYIEWNKEITAMESDKSRYIQTLKVLCLASGICPTCSITENVKLLAATECAYIALHIFSCYSEIDGEQEALRELAIRTKNFE